MSVAALGVAAAMSAGCADYTTREEGGARQAAVLNSMYAGAATRPSSAARHAFAAPAVLAVAQVGEIAPPESLLAPLRADAALFRRIESVPALDGDADVPRWGVPADEASAAREAALQRRVDALRGLASAAGADYLLIVGDTADRATGPTPLGVLNLTIVGCFVVPSRHTDVVVKVSGAVIDARTGQVVTLASAEQRDDCTSTAATADTDATRLMARLREKAAGELAEKVRAACRGEGRGVAVSSR